MSIVVHVCNLSTQEVETGRPWVWELVIWLQQICIKIKQHTTDNFTSKRKIYECTVRFVKSDLPYCMNIRIWGSFIISFRVEKLFYDVGLKLMIMLEEKIHNVWSGFAKREKGWPILARLMYIYVALIMKTLSQIFPKKRKAKQSRH